jgi:two-component system phosphate regulon sensor histidine kinase PhoR
MHEITEKQREFAAVTESMREGLILVSGKGNILSINKSATAIFGADSNTSIGNHILTVNRSVEMQSVFEGAIKGCYTEALIPLHKKHYKLLGNPALPKDDAPAAVILVLDVTDKHNAEHSRREFTANVSHELKTPLTSISGFAEIMRNGTANPEDMPGFAGRIYNEANRLIALIDDILKLSQLDEMAKLPDKETVDLYTLAEDVTGRLKPMADKQGVSISLTGGNITVTGYRKVLDAMLYNLCDNAIKYNIAGGSVSVDISCRGNKPAITVQDTGIGIPAEHQSHVFERFYRVDKSRSKETGGTGLGLSIVKHGAMLHDVIIDLKSKENAGTTVVLAFPRGCGLPGDYNA